ADGTQGRPGVAPVGRLEYAAGAEDQARGVGRVQDVGDVEVGVAGDARRLGGPRVAAVVGPLQADPEKLVVHRLGIGGVHAGVAAVVGADLVPRRVAGRFLGAGVLAAAVDDGGVGRVEGDADKGGDLEVGIQVGPLDRVHVGILQSPNARVVAVQ